LLLLQIVFSRLFASTLSYYYAFMLVSLAMLGLAAGGLAIQIFPRLFPADRVWSRAAFYSVATAIAIQVGCVGVLASYPYVQFESTLVLEARSLAPLAAIFWFSFPPFLFGGLVLSGILAHSGAAFHRFYAVDLVFAAGGCALGLALLTSATPVETLLRVAPVLPLLAATLFALEGGRTKLAALVVAAALLLAAVGSWLAAAPERARPPHRGWIGKPEVLSEWNASSAVRVHPWRFFSWSLSSEYRGPEFPMLDLIIDGLGGTPIVRFDGRAESLAAYEYLDHDLTALPQHLVPAAGRQLIIGPGGGVDILQAVRAGRSDVTVVEINPLVERVVNRDLEEFSGAPYGLPGVSVFIENGRTFVKRTEQHWDLLTLTWVDTGGSATALALSENYLYTVEAFRDYLTRLTDRGMLAFLRAWDSPDFHVDSLRGIAAAMEALEAQGAARPDEHLLVAAVKSPAFSRPMALVMVQRGPYSVEQVEVARRFLAERNFVPIWLPDHSLARADLPPAFRPIGNLLFDLLESGDRDALFREAPLDFAPSTDDNPFYFVQRAGANRPAGAGTRELRNYSAILAGLVVPFLFAPLVPLARSTRSLGLSGVAALGYFSLIGVSFMLVEIEFFHRFALLLGRPTLTLATVLASLLVFSGIGSTQGKRIAEGSVAGLARAFGGLLSVLLAFAWLGPALFERLIGQPLWVRIVSTVLIVAPIGYFMGIPMPVGMHLVRDRRDIVLWGWALNGALSVFASVAAIYLAIEAGVAFAFFCGALGYLLAALLATRVRLHPISS